MASAKAAMVVASRQSSRRKRPGKGRARASTPTGGPAAEGALDSPAAAEEALTRMRAHGVSASELLMDGATLSRLLRAWPGVLSRRGPLTKQALDVVFVRVKGGTSGGKAIGYKQFLEALQECVGFQPPSATLVNAPLTHCSCLCLAHPQNRGHSLRKDASVPPDGGAGSAPPPPPGSGPAHGQVCAPAGAVAEPARRPAPRVGRLPRASTLPRPAFAAHCLDAAPRPARGAAPASAEERGAHSAVGLPRAARPPGDAATGSHDVSEVRAACQVRRPPR